MRGIFFEKPFISATIFSMTGKKILLSGVKPTGRPHIGNYLGAMRQFVELQDNYQNYVFVADYHALTTVHTGAELSENIFGVVLDYLAIGIDPQKSLIYKQSDVGEHTELAWIFNCITTMPYLMRAHAFKDAEAKNKDITVGTFDYPMLMAADILLYDADVVPVGQDQKQHIEFARDTALKFNHIYGDTFTLPEPLILDEVAVVPGIDGQKMSKSHNNTIPLFASHTEITKAVMSIITDSKEVGDSKDPKNDTLFTLHSFFSQDQLAELEERYKEGKIGYKESKEILIDNLEAFIAPMREKRKELEKDRDYVVNILKEGAAMAQERAAGKMTDVRKKIGITIS